MLFIFPTPVSIKYLWQLKTVVFLHWCLICTVLLQVDRRSGPRASAARDGISEKSGNGTKNTKVTYWFQHYGSPVAYGLQNLFKKLAKGISCLIYLYRRWRSLTVGC